MGKEQEQTESVVVQGIVCPWGWDESNNVTNVLLSSKGERDYRVKKSIQGDALIPYCGKHVEIHGILRRTKGVELLEVIRFEEKAFSS